MTANEFARSRSISVAIAAGYGLCFSCAALLAMTWNWGVRSLLDTADWWALLGRIRYLTMHDVLLGHTFQLPIVFPLAGCVLFVIALKPPRNLWKLIALAIGLAIVVTVADLLFMALMKELPLIAQDFAALSNLLLGLAVVGLAFASSVKAFRGEAWARDAMYLTLPHVSLVLALTLRTVLWEQDIPLTVLAFLPYLIALGIAESGVTSSDQSVAGPLWGVPSFLAGSVFALVALGFWYLALRAVPLGSSAADNLEQYMGSAVTLGMHYLPGCVVLAVAQASGARRRKSD